MRPYSIKEYETPFETQINLFFEQNHAFFGPVIIFNNKLILRLSITFGRITIF